MTSTVFIKLLQIFAKQNKRLFTLKEIVAYSGESFASASMSLLRAKKNGFVGCVNNLWFNLLEPPTLEEVALELRSPAYISFESALYKHGVLSQSPRGELVLATTLRPCRIYTPFGNIRYIHLAKDIFRGFDDTRLALPEKAFLDMIYIRAKSGKKHFPEVFYLENLNKKKMSALAKAFPLWLQKILPDVLKKLSQ